MSAMPVTTAYSLSAGGVVLTPDLSSFIVTPICSFTIGENSKIGAGSVVLEEVPPNCTVVGVPGRIVRMDNKKVPRSDMDQVHLPDPVLTDIRELQEENIKLHKRLESMIKYMRCVEKENKESKNDEDL